MKGACLNGACLRELLEKVNVILFELLFVDIVRRRQNQYSEYLPFERLFQRRFVSDVQIIICYNDVFQLFYNLNFVFYFFIFGVRYLYFIKAIILLRRVFILIVFYSFIWICFNLSFLKKKLKIILKNLFYSAATF